MHTTEQFELDAFGCKIRKRKTTEILPDGGTLHVPVTLMDNRRKQPAHAILWDGAPAPTLTRSGNLSDEQRKLIADGIAKRNAALRDAWRAPATPLGDDRAASRRFAVTATLASGRVSSFASTA
jgi:hypothetical protein